MCFRKEWSVSRILFEAVTTMSAIKSVFALLSSSARASFVQRIICWFEWQPGSKRPPIFDAQLLHHESVASVTEFTKFALCRISFWQLRIPRMLSTRSAGS